MCRAVCVERGKQTSLPTRSVRTRKARSVPSRGSTRANGSLNIGITGWRSANVWLFAFSESGGRQETLLLMPAGRWIRTSLGHFILEPEVRRPWLHSLYLCPHGRNEPVRYRKGTIALKRPSRLPSPGPGPSLWFRHIHATV